MKDFSILKSMKQSLQNLLCVRDGRMKISAYDFVTSLIFSFQGDTKQVSLESLRRTMKDRLGQSTSRSAFGEHLSGKRLNTLLLESVTALMSRLCQEMGHGQPLLKQQLSVNQHGFRIFATLRPE